MLSRVAIALFYAIVFFALGAWAGNRVPSLRDVMNRGAEATWSGAQRLKTWAESTVSSETPRQQEVAQPKKQVKAAPEQSIADARNLFAKGNVSEAIAAYQALLKARPGDADAWGELGNVYLSSGRLDDASRAFYEAATRLIARGDAAKARALAPAIRANAPALADEIERQLKEAQSPHAPAGPSKAI